MPHQAREVLVPVLIGRTTEFLQLDYNAAATYSVEFNAQVNTDHPLGDRLKIQAVTVEEAVGTALMKNPALRYADIVKHHPVKGDPVSVDDEYVMVPVRVSNVTEFRMLNQHETSTYLIVFGQSIETSDPNGDRLAMGASSIEEAVGVALIENPTMTYDDIVDHMEV